MKIASQQLGQTAEDLAANYLKKKKFAIKTRNYRYGRTEIGIIAQKNRLLVFSRALRKQYFVHGYSVRVLFHENWLLKG
jgi:Holliday junction resolvase-like predicted endonuclease